MRAAGNTTSTIKLSKSPVPFLFGSLAFVLVLIAVALAMLVCSYKKTSANSTDEDTEEKPAAAKHITVLDAEPKIVVIMAGNDKPTYLATPITSLVCTCEQV